MNRHFPPIEDVTRRIFITGALASALLIACGSDDDETPEDAGPTTRVVTHMMGETEIPVRPQRIVTLWRPTLAALAQLGLRPAGSVGDAGTPNSGLAPFLPDGYAVKDLAIIGPNNQFDLEKIASLAPDLIIGALTNTGIEKDLYPQLSSIAPTVLVEWLGTASWRKQLLDVADVLDLRPKADELVQAYERRVAEVRSAVGNVGSIDVSLVRIQGPGALRLETPLSFPGSVVQDIGFARPKVQQAPEAANSDYIQISPERIRDADGDLIFVFFNANNSQVWKDIEATPLWQGLEGQKNGKVFTFEYEWWGASNYFSAHRILDDIQKALKA